MQPEFDTAKAHSARVYDFYLGGKDHFAVDRETGLKAMESWPAVRTAVRENRAFLGRAVRYLAGQAGIRQFLDIGSGLPSAENVHEVAQAIAPPSRIVYVDNDPARVVATLLGALAPGSYLVASHVTPEHDPAGVGGLVRTYRQAGLPAQARTAREFAVLAFGGLELIDPGVVLVSQWHPPADPRPLPAEVNWYGGVGRKPAAV
jgi:S-adenosyl methyltransferase